MKNYQQNKVLGQKNIPNILSLFRLILVFPIIFLLETNKLDLIWILIIMGGISDYLDGYLARRFELKSKFGAIIDPVSDKVFILIPLIWLCIEKIIPYWSISVIVFRELVISALRKQNKDGLPALKLAKFKTFFFFIFLVIVFSPLKNALIFNIALLSYWLAFILTIISTFNYLIIKDNTIRT